MATMTWTATSTALYVRTLAALGAKLVYQVPHRKNDGYDLKAEAVDWAQAQGADAGHHVGLRHPGP